MIKLSRCYEGDRVTVAKIAGSGALRRRLLEMGLTRGQPVNIVKYAPLRDPMEIEVMGSHISLRVEEAEHLMVVPAPAQA